MKGAYGLLKIIKGYHIQVCLSSHSPIEKISDSYTVYPVVVAGGLPNLVILSTIQGRLEFGDGGLVSALARRDQVRLS